MVLFSFVIFIIVAQGSNYGPLHQAWGAGAARLSRACMCHVFPHYSDEE